MTLNSSPEHFDICLLTSSFNHTTIIFLPWPCECGLLLFILLCFTLSPLELGILTCGLCGSSWYLVDRPDAVMIRIILTCPAGCMDTVTLWMRIMCPNAVMLQIHERNIPECRTALIMIISLRDVTLIIVYWPVLQYQSCPLYVTLIRVSGSPLLLLQVSP